MDKIMTDEVRQIFATEFPGRGKKRLYSYCLALALSEDNMCQSESKWIFAACVSSNCLLIFAQRCDGWSWLRPAPGRGPCHPDPRAPFHLCCSADVSHAHTIHRALESSEVLFLRAVKVPVSEKCIRSQITQI